MNMTKDEMVKLRQDYAIRHNSGGYGYWKNGEPEQKKSKISKDPLSKEDRKRIDEIKERLNGEPVESDLW